MTLKFAIGAIVELKSGGPSMTVTKDRPEEGSKFVQIAWFDGSALNRAIMPRDALTVTAEAPPKPSKPAKTEAE